MYITGMKPLQTNIYFMERALIEDIYDNRILKRWKMLGLENII
jgi:hypothetical protein